MLRVSTFRKHWYSAGSTSRRTAGSKRAAHGCVSKNSWMIGQNDSRSPPTQMEMAAAPRLGIGRKVVLDLPGSDGSGDFLRQRGGQPDPPAFYLAPSRERDRRARRTKFAFDPLAIPSDSAEGLSDPWQ